MNLLFNLARRCLPFHRISLLLHTPFDVCTLLYCLAEKSPLRLPEISPSDHNILIIRAIGRIRTYDNSSLQVRWSRPLSHYGKNAELLTDLTGIQQREKTFNLKCMLPYYLLYSHHPPVATPISPIEFLCPSWVFKRKAIYFLGFLPLFHPSFKYSSISSFFTLFALMVLSLSIL